MSLSVAQAYLADILHVISQALLVPVIALLLISIAYALFCIGSVFSEWISERRHFKVAMPKFLSALMEASQDEVPKVIEESGLLKRQKSAMLTVYEYRTLPGDALIALIKRLVSEEESRYDRIRSRNNIMARIAPMIGLMGTLIPLGPGIEALGRADTAALSSSLLVAFDTTVAGLVVAAVCLAVGKIRGNWYENYLTALDAGMATLLEKIEGMRAAGQIETKEPADYAFLFDGQPGAQPNAEKPAATASAQPATTAESAVSTATDASSMTAGFAAPDTTGGPVATDTPVATDAFQPSSSVAATEPPYAPWLSSIGVNTAAAPASSPAPQTHYAVPETPADSMPELTMPSGMPLTQEMRDNLMRKQAVDQASASAPAASQNPAQLSADEKTGDSGYHFEPPRRPWE